ncbi:MAG: 3-hydroxyacyl-CoA dehydrogenase family protein [Acidimicrobiaceae bacterium]|nr:3-hydroxyacyl-CoA dehydrogenase family protein [Acidimicrobiaceae bacterium]MXW76995.1 3-hydroxyacyl-CoA dehydrogenase family protein [Acidimicrobiaceae bacterium]MYA74277.1 3-hydroxyacyl-CoA dehydrogenase family protein [Acidimicrobiaceae bacterium]MYC43633.1 3-hydroxyacyl-CoA dehydrogenase family protein [Acidimicrobiaceae bacterium]MYD05658.1 3-hydroxyacyl-CoA dehydrogenase family protein [Acidimicrobiaceae bacterium]
MGAGVMGSGIAQVMAIAGHEVVCRDLNREVLNVARTSVDSGRFGVRGAVERQKLTNEQADAALGRITFTTDLEEAVNTDVIIEAIPEDLALKIRFWRELDSIAPGHTIFASNSSGFSIAALGAATDRADRMVGWHWASPAPVMKLAEIVRGPLTSSDTVDTVVRLAASAGKNPVVVNDTDTTWGYVTNRVYFAMVREANRVVSEGIADRSQVDQLMTDCFRWPSGPFGMVTGATSGWSQ